MKHKRIYITTIVISIGLIFFSFLPYGWKVWENIFVSIGCSGITAAIMAIFLELYDVKKEENRREQLRHTFLAGLNYELRKLFERVLWFENVLDKIDLSKDVKYYLSLDFISEAYSVGYYRQSLFNECVKEIELICRKYELESLNCMDNETRLKVQKMFSIIGSASMPIISEIDIIKRNQMFLMTNDIFSSKELSEIYTFIDNQVEMLQTSDTGYGTVLRFLLSGYEKTQEQGRFENDIMIIAWKSDKNLGELVLEKRRNNIANSVVECQEEIKKEGVWQKVRRRFPIVSKLEKVQLFFNHREKGAD